MAPERKLRNNPTVRNVLFDIATGAIAALMFVLFMLAIPQG